jgi:hypothetical protein
MLLINQQHTKATVEKVLKALSADNKDARKAEWNNKEVSFISRSSHDDKEHRSITQLIEEGVTPH